MILVIAFISSFSCSQCCYVIRYFCYLCIIIWYMSTVSIVVYVCSVLLQDINTRKPFRSSVVKDQQVVSLATRPLAIGDTYHYCEPPPALQKLNPYRYVNP